LTCFYPHKSAADYFLSQTFHIPTLNLSSTARYRRRF